MNSPFFSICIPQYNRTSFLLRVLESLNTQTFRNFEICISDDCSTDGREQEIINYLQETALKFEYSKTEKNIRYDKNLRRAIGLANGRYCFLLGNDDMLAGPETLAQLHAVMRSHNFPEVVVTNYQEITTGLTYRRMQFTGVLGSGARTAANNFRNFSFVSGLIFDRELARKHETDQWDVAAFYQTRHTDTGVRVPVVGCVRCGYSQRCPDSGRASGYLSCLAGSKKLSHH
jgi:glycosyltransferase involved in cell wall biosynthesis